MDNPEKGALNLIQQQKEFEEKLTKDFNEKVKTLEETFMQKMLEQQEKQTALLAQQTVLLEIIRNISISQQESNRHTKQPQPKKSKKFNENSYSSSQEDGKTSNDYHNNRWQMSSDSDQSAKFFAKKRK
jgi:hypothetical protein